jgi:opacity protein-like surface antigen
MNKTSLLMGCALIASTSLIASEDQWTQHLTAYFMGAGMDGDVAIGGLETSIDIGFDEIWDNLEFGTMVNYRAEKGKLSLGLDVIYMALGGDGPGQIKVDFDQWMVQGDVGWRISDVVELLVGLRYNDLEGKIKFPSLGVSREQGQSWVDPLVGARITLPLSDSWNFLARGDIGGFDTGSALAWQLGAYFQYQTSGSLSVIAGYRVLSMDYEDGTGANRFLYDVTTQGPVAGLSWQF